MNMSITLFYSFLFIYIINKSLRTIKSIFAIFEKILSVYIYIANFDFSALQQ